MRAIQSVEHACQEGLYRWAAGCGKPIVREPAFHDRRVRVRGADRRGHAGQHVGVSGRVVAPIAFAAQRVRIVAVVRFGVKGQVIDYRAARGRVSKVAAPRVAGAARSGLGWIEAGGGLTSGVGDGIVGRCSGPTARLKVCRLQPG